MLHKLLKSKGDYHDCPWREFDVILEKVESLPSGKLCLQVSDSSGTGSVFCTHSGSEQIRRNGKRKLGRMVTLRGYSVTYTPKDIEYRSKENTKIIAHDIVETDVVDNIGFEKLSLSA